LIDLTSFLKMQEASSHRAHGQQRSPLAPAGDVASALNGVRQDPRNLYNWVQVILAAMEGGLRSGATPFALSQALLNQVTANGRKPMPPPLAQFDEEQQVNRQAPSQPTTSQIPADQRLPSATELLPDPPGNPEDEAILAAARTILRRRGQQGEPNA
jgi:hypothetical protein